MNDRQNGTALSPGRVLVALIAVVLSFALLQCSDPASAPVVQPTQPAAPAKVVEGPVLGFLQNGSQYFFSTPAAWQDLVVYAHGYYAPDDDPWSPDKDKVGNTPIFKVVNSLGYAYASTSYPDQGLIVPEAVQDVVDLVAQFVVCYGRQPRFIFLVGPSEGGLVTTLAIEKYPNVFNGGLAMCGPIGDFRKQLNYLGDFHVVFNYFFRGVVPGGPKLVPQNVIDGWYTPGGYQQDVKDAVAANRHAADQLLSVTKAPIDPSDQTTIEKTIVDVLWYNVFATNDAIMRLQGYPFDNKRPYRIYYGSDNDLLLNLRIPRYSADQSALNNINSKFQTSGVLARPLVTMHTTGDPIVPYWHAPLYGLKTLGKGSGLLHTHIPILRYGHCNFTISEVLAGFAVLVLRVSLRELVIAERVIPDPGDQATMLSLAKVGGAHPKIQRAAKPE